MTSTAIEAYRQRRSMWKLVERRLKIAQQDYEARYGKTKS
jgi:hypothetical protein